jgi:hypothetical protein
MRDINEGYCCQTAPPSADLARGAYYVEVLLRDPDDDSGGGITWRGVGKAVVDRAQSALPAFAGLIYLQPYDSGNLSAETPLYYEFPGQTVRSWPDIGRFCSMIDPVVQKSFLGQRRPTSKIETVATQMLSSARPLETLERRLEFSVPVPGRPLVPWVQGIDPATVREHWSADESPFAQPVQGFQGIGAAKKIVAYSRAEPRLRLVLLLGDVFECDGQKRQPILQTRIERDRGIDPKQSRSLEEHLWSEICRVERRGRPRGTGRPKRKPYERLGINAEMYLSLEKLGLTNSEIQVFGSWSQGTPQNVIARQRHVSPSAISQTLVRAQNKIRKVNPKFSFRKFGSIPGVVGIGQRWKNRRLERDESGRTFRRDPKREL